MAAKFLEVPVPENFFLKRLSCETNSAIQKFINQIVHDTAEGGVKI